MLVCMSIYLLQVIDNFPSGRVKVWWVDGHTSMCWPQDLYKVVQNEMLGPEGAEVIHPSIHMDSCMTVGYGVNQHRTIMRDSGFLAE